MVFSLNSFTDLYIFPLTTLGSRAAKMVVWAAWRGVFIDSLKNGNIHRPRLIDLSRSFVYATSGWMPTTVTPLPGKTDHTRCWQQHQWSLTFSCTWKTWENTKWYASKSCSQVGLINGQSRKIIKWPQPLSDSCLCKQNAKKHRIIVVNMVSY